MSRTRRLLAFTIFATFTLNITGQNYLNKFEFGFSVNQFQSDFGVGLDLVSPYFIHYKVAVKAGANLQWFEHFNGTETSWIPYQNFQLGIRVRNAIIENKLFIYSEGGAVIILPNSKFSSNNTELGGYGVFGFEFKTSSKIAYYIELGGVGTGATADQVTNKPIYSNGFLTSVGFTIGI